MIQNRTTPKPPSRAHLAAALGDESGAARHDRLLLLGAGAVVGALVLFSWPTQAPAPAASPDVAGAPVPAPSPARTVSSGSALAPEPSPPSGPDAPRTYVSVDYPSMLTAPPDNEEALLDALTDHARAVDAAAFAAGAFGDAPPSGAAPEPAGADGATVADTDTSTAADGT